MFPNKKCEMMVVVILFVNTFNVSSLIKKHMVVVIFLVLVLKTLFLEMFC